MAWQVKYVGCRVGPLGDLGLGSIPLSFIAFATRRLVSESRRRILRCTSKCGQEVRPMKSKAIHLIADIVVQTVLANGAGT